jgi:hypothetical protein
MQPTTLPMRAFRDRLADEGLLAVHDHWCAGLRGTLLPPRSAIDPVALKRWLPRMFMVDVDGGAYRFRLAGTDLRRIFDRDITGLTLAEVLPERMLADALRGYEQVRRDRTPHLVELVLDMDSHPAYFYRRLVLPLAKDGVEVDRLLGVYTLEFADYRRDGDFYRILGLYADRITGRAAVADLSAAA